MLVIHCPSCDADRPESEFACGGPVPAARPAPPDLVSAAAWAGYLHFAANPRGLAAERWCHRAGCGSWFVVWRDTATHRIHVVTRIGDPAPEIAR